MRALTIWQPWASAIAYGPKRRLPDHQRCDRFRERGCQRCEHGHDTFLG
jgi:hypothetical protein